MSAAENLLQLKKQLPSQVTLVAVSKTKPAYMISECYEAGHRDFGENYVQELVDKHEELPQDIRWHFIGHLQSNKVKYIVPFVHLIHGVDSVKLLKEINKQAAKNNLVVKVLLQVFIASEETKFGLDATECEELFRSGILNDLKNIEILGFMGMASNTDDQEKIRSEFRTLKQLQEKLKTNERSLSVLSFGMSGDYKLAIEEGSTMVRIGSTIFGERNYSK